MVDEADIRLIDAEPKRFGGDHNLVVATHELLLNLLALPRLHLAVVVAGRDTVVFQPVEQLISRLDAGGIDDAGTVFTGDQLADARQLGVKAHRRIYGEMQVGALGAGIDHHGVLRMEHAQDFFADLVRSGSR